MDNQVLITRINNGDIFTAMKKLCDSVGVTEKDNVNKIGIKINLCDYRLPSSGVTTDPLVLEALLKVLRAKYSASAIYLFENDASGTCADNLFTVLKITELADKYSCHVVNLAKEKWISKDINGLYFKNIDVPEILEDMDILINHPKLKTHGTTKITVSMKNMFGCVHDKYKAKYHNRIDDVIVDINKAIKSDYCIVDGNICLEGIGGPTYGTPKKCGVLIGGRNVVSVDAFCAKYMGFHPSLVTHVRKADRTGLGNRKYKLQLIDYEGYRPAKFKFNIYQYYLLRLFRDAI